jgi:hypothetical protein
VLGALAHWPGLTRPRLAGFQVSTEGQVAKALHVALATLARAVPKTSGRAPRVSARQVAGA